MNLKLAEIGLGADDPSFQQFFTTQFTPDATTEQMRAFTELQRVSTSPQFAVRHLRAVFDIDVTELAPKIRCPTLVLHVSQGLDNAQIAAWLELSEKTVRNYITAIFSKLEVVTRAQAIVRAVKQATLSTSLKSSR